MKSNENSLEKITGDLQNGIPSPENPKSTQVGGGYSLKTKKRKGKGKGKKIDTSSKCSEVEMMSPEPERRKSSTISFSEPTPKKENSEREVIAPKKEENKCETVKVKEEINQKTQVNEEIKKGVEGTVDVEKVPEEKSVSSDSPATSRESSEIPSEPKMSTEERREEIKPTKKGFEFLRDPKLQMIKETADLPRSISLSQVDNQFGFDTRKANRLLVVGKRNNSLKTAIDSPTSGKIGSYKKPNRISKTCQACSTPFGVSNWRVKEFSSSKTFNLSKPFKKKKSTYARAVRTCSVPSVSQRRWPFRR